MDPLPGQDEDAQRPSHRRPSALLGKPVMVALVVAAVATAAFAVVAVRIHHQASPPAEIRVSGLPPSVPTPLASLMALSPVPHEPAPDFSLVDQNGRGYSLSAFRGKSVVLEFMDPHCTDICPIISQEFVDAYHDLGGDRSKVVFLAVNVNPFHLAVSDAAAFTTEHQLNTVPSWHFLTGPVGTLMATWQHYGVQVDAPNPNADVIHSSFVYFVDPSGQERYLGAPQDDHRASGASYLPADQIAAWGQGIALVARSLATPSPPS